MLRGARGGTASPHPRRPRTAATAAAKVEERVTSASERFTRDIASSFSYDCDAGTPKPSALLCAIQYVDIRWHLVHFGAIMRLLSISDAQAFKSRSFFSDPLCPGTRSDSIRLSYLVIIFQILGVLMRLSSPTSAAYMKVLKDYN
jgi:hypothetical protein